MRSGPLTKSGEDGESRQVIHLENTSFFLKIIFTNKKIFTTSFCMQVFLTPPYAYNYCAVLHIISFHLQIPLKTAGKTRHNKTETAIFFP